MDLAWTAEDTVFRDEVRAFLDENLTAELRQAGAAMTSVFTDVKYSLPWQRILNAKGWAAPTWPVEYGGPGWSDTQRYIFSSECALAGAPGLGPMGLRMVGPVLMTYGSPQQKAHYLPRILSGEDYWCQGYSEPQAGSDLAALALNAQVDGDHYVLTGSKIWTTHAHWANRMFALVRTNASGKRQQGITFLLLDMTSPGITVAPIITLAGEHEVNQVFFDAVRVPVANRLGEENDGWTVAKALLEFERGGGSAAGLKIALDHLRAVGSKEDDGEGGSRLDDPDFRHRLAEAQTAILAIEITEHRVLSAYAAGGNPGPVSSVLKIQGSEARQRLDALAIDLAGAYGEVYQPLAREPGSNLDPIGPAHSLTAMARYLNNRAATIYGGSNEVQRNIIGRLILAL